MKAFEKPLVINEHTARNRFVMPPMVIYEHNKLDGLVQPATVQHYKNYAQSGAGMVVVEATGVYPDARLSLNQLGLWDDNFISGQAQIASAIKEGGALAVVQIHHAGLKSVVKKVTASPYLDGEVEIPSLTLKEIDEVIEQFVSACVRAEKAGYDGIELHGAHGYLLSQFFSTSINHRTDIFGGNAENRARLATTIVQRVREKVSSNFIVGIRMGCNDTDAVEYAKLLEKAGCNYLHCSFGFERNNLDKPEGFVGEAIQYKASLVKKAVTIPTIAVFRVKTPQMAGNLLEQNACDMVAIGRSLLVDPHWFTESLNGQSVTGCLDCNGCKWHQPIAKGGECPGHKLWLSRVGTADSD